MKCIGLHEYIGSQRLAKVNRSKYDKRQTNKLLSRCKKYVWNKTIDYIEQRLLVIRKTFTSNNELEIKFSFSNANLKQYTPEVVVYLQAQRFFVEHCIKESE